VTGPAGAALAVAVGYLLGAVPVGLLIGRVVGGVDLRELGSRRTGATNAMRTLGTGWAILVLLLDVGKGLAAVLVARALYQAGPPGSTEWVAAAAGIAAVVGHNWSVFIRFTGGRGVATTGGGLLALSPLSVAAVVPLMLLVAWRTRYVSAASLAGAVGAMAVTGALALAGPGGWPAFGYALLAGTLIIVSHGDNIARLRAGTERRIGEKEALRSDGQN
jgi:acyl phosphate:glycerol-3-phosphate acyltransferase